MLLKRDVTGNVLLHGAADTDRHMLYHFNIGLSPINIRTHKFCSVTSFKTNTNEIVVACRCRTDVNDVA